MLDLPDVALPAVSESAVLRKVTLRLIPFLFLLYVINLIDRTNVGMASLQMVADPNRPDEAQYAILSEGAYTLGAGLFYVGYLLFEVPSNLIMMRVGARAWIARILFSWGAISAAMMFVTGPWSFFTLRILLGVAEAGFFPGVIYYLSDWFPARARARCVSMFMVGGVIASMIGNPISGVILQYLDRVGGLRGYQWVFLLEGLPAVALGFVTVKILTDKPEQADWLDPAEKAWLSNQMALDRHASGAGRNHTLWAACVNPRVWLLIAVYFTVAMGDNSFGFLIPRFLKEKFPGWTEAQIGLLVAIPSVVAIVGMLLISRHSDQTGERRWHVAGAAFLASAGWLAAALAPSPWLFVVAAAITLTGMKSMLPTFWTLPSSFLTGAAAAGGIALINSVANLGGLLGPNIVKALKSESHGYTNGYFVMAGVLFLGGCLVLRVRANSPATAAIKPVVDS